MNPASTFSAPAGFSAQRAAVALALLLGLQPVTTDLYLPALPRLGLELLAPMSAVQLTMSALLLSFGLAQLVMGPLADRFGRRPVLLGGLSSYVLAGLLAAAAPSVEALIGARILQGVGLAAAVVCARAMVRDLYEPQQGAQVMSRALSGLGVLAIASPVVGGLLTSVFGWRAAMLAVAFAGLVTLLFVWRRVPETAPQHQPGAGSTLLQDARQVLSHPGFRAWTALTSATYGGLYVILASSSFVYIGVMGLSAWSYGLVMASGSLAYLGGTIWCRRLLPHHSLTGAVRRAAGFTLAGGAGMLLLGLFTDGGAAVLPWMLLSHWLFCFAHGVHQPCGQAGAVGAFPRMAGVASALSGFTLALTAFLTGLWLGRMMDGSLRMFSIGLGSWAVVIALLAWTLVQRHGQHFSSAPTPSDAPA